MPSADRYARYRADQTTIWVSKRAAEFLARERAATGEATAAALDRLLGELRSLRKAGGGAGGAAKAARGGAKSASKSAAKGGAKSAARGSRSAAKTGGRAAAR